MISFREVEFNDLMLANAVAGMLRATADAVVGVAESGKSDGRWYLELLVGKLIADGLIDPAKVLKAANHDTVVV